MTNPNLTTIDTELLPVLLELQKLTLKCEAINEGRVAHEIQQGINALNEARTLIKFYLSNEKLPSLQEVRTIFHGNQPK